MLDIKDLEDGSPDSDDGYEPDACPKCGEKKLFRGYGLMGGGCGSYEGCDACDYFDKTQDPECD